MDGGSGKVYTTDTHLRCKTGKAIWNWRIKFPLELPLKNRENGRLRVEVWDWDLFGDGDMIGGNKIDLYDWLLKAYHTPNSISVFPFKEEKLAREQLLHDKGLLDDASASSNPATQIDSEEASDDEEEERSEEEEENENEDEENLEDSDGIGDRKNKEDKEDMKPLLGNKKASYKGNDNVDADEVAPKKPKKPEVKDPSPLEQIYSFLGYIYFIKILSN